MDIKGRAGDLEMGEIALGLVASIWDGDLQYSNEDD